MLSPYIDGIGKRSPPRSIAAHFSAGITMGAGWLPLEYSR